jgi:hypothetical protein
MPCNAVAAARRLPSAIEAEGWPEAGTVDLLAYLADLADSEANALG